MGDTGRAVLAARLRLGPPASGRRGPARVRGASRPAGRAIHPLGHDARRGARRGAAAARQHDAGARGGLPDERHRRGSTGWRRISATRFGSFDAAPASRPSSSPRSRWGSAARPRCSASFRRCCSRRCRTSSRASSFASTSRSPTSPTRGSYLAGTHFTSLRDHAASFEDVAALAHVLRDRPRPRQGRAGAAAPRAAGHERLLPHAAIGPVARPGIRPRRRGRHAPRGAERCGCGERALAAIRRSSARPFN